jgi:hypothetical protein
MPQKVMGPRNTKTGQRNTRWHKEIHNWADRYKIQYGNKRSSY